MNQLKTNENETDFSVSKAKNLIQQILRITGEMVTLSETKDDSLEELERAEKEAELMQKKNSARKELEKILDSSSFEIKSEITDYLFLENVRINRKGDVLSEITAQAVSNL